MVRDPAAARRVLDHRFERLRSCMGEARPNRGWIRAIRDGLGMSGAELGSRMGVSQSTLAEIERNEHHRTIRMETLQRAADALGCDVVYFLVPRVSLEEAVRARAREKATRHLARVAHHSALEDQAVDPEAAASQLERLTNELIDERGLWSETGE